MDLTPCCCQIARSNVFYKIIPNDNPDDEDDYEIMFHKDLTEDQILHKVLSITIVNSTDEIIRRLKYLFACIAFGNCARVNKSLRAIINVMHYLTQRPQYFKKVSTIVLQLVELIMLTKEMATSWKPMLPNILRILICGFRFETKPATNGRILSIMENIACVLPIEKTVNIIRGYMVLEYEDLREWDRLLWSLKLLSTLAIKRGAEITPREVRKVKNTLITLSMDSCTLVSTTSIHALVDIYVNTSIFEPKSQILNELEKMIPHGMDIAREYYDEVHFFFYETEVTICQPEAECVKHSESEIIELACQITYATPLEQRQQALKDLCSCIIYENCDLAIANFRRILQMLMKLLKYAQTSEEFTMALDVISVIFRSKPMRPYWTVYYREIMLRIILSYDYDKETTEAIDFFVQNVAESLPVTNTIKIVDTLIATAEYPYNLCAMKIVWEIAGQHKLFPKTNLDKLLATVVCTIDDPEKNIRLVAECVIFKLCTKLGEKRITSAITKNLTMNRRLRVLLARTRRFSM